MPEYGADKNSSVRDRTRSLLSKDSTWNQGTNGAGHASNAVMLRNHCLTQFALLAGIFATGLAVSPARAQNSPQPDNTKVNKRDRASGAVTADQQKNNRSDRDLTKEIRKAVEADKSLSTYAHNVKIITQDGAVTLKGPVKSEDEKKQIVAKAEEVAGSGKVTDQLSVKAAQ
jgi:osmotically-inducible protein OsmY